MIKPTSTICFLLYFNFCKTELMLQNEDFVAAKIIIHNAAEIANENFDFRKLTVVLYKNVPEILIDNFLKLYKGSVVINTKDGVSPGHILILVDTVKSCMELLNQLRPYLKGKSLLRSGAKFLIVVLQNSKPFENITKLLWNHQAIDVIILTFAGNKTALLTYYPYKNHLNCHDTEPKVIGYWKEPELIGKELYTNKMKDMKECPLYISTNKLYHPATEKKIPLQIVKKTLLRLLKDILNFTPIISNREYISIDSDRARNWSDSLNDVVNGLANISTCSIPLAIDRMGLLDYSMPYFRVRLAWLAPPVSQKAVWWRLLSPLDGYLWLILLILLFIITSLPFLLKLRFVKKFCYQHFKNIAHLPSVTIRIWGVMLGQPIRVAPRRFRDFYILSLWLWFTFVIRSAYQSVLISALKTDRITGAFTDLNDAIDNGFKFGGREGIYAYFEHDPLIREQFKIVKEENYEQTFFNVVEQREKFVLATSLEYAWAYCLALGKKEMECGYVLPDSIMTVPLVIWMKIHSPFKRSLKDWLPRLIDSGLLKKDSIVKPICCLSKSSDPTPLTSHQTLSCLLCLFVGNITSITVFAMELFRHKTKKFKIQFKHDFFRKPYPYRN